MAFEGSCHCGEVAFTVDADPPAEAISCNCSHCRRKGFLLAFFPLDRFQLLRGEESLKSYLFYKHAIEHQFCTKCGTEPFALGKMPDGTQMRAINLRCVETIDLGSLDLRKVDGASF